MTRVRSLGTLWAFSVALAALILAPVLGGVIGDGEALLYRDAVSTPRSFVTDTAMGLGETPARAVPQDWLLALASHAVDGSLIVAGLTFGALVLAGVGSGLLALRVVPAARTPGALAAAALAIWNPYVAERLLQGQWSLLVGYGALGWIVVSAHRCLVAPTRGTWLSLLAWSAVAGLTPTGSVLAAFVVLAVLVIPVLWNPSATAHEGVLRVIGAAAVVVLASLPWLVASVLTSAGATSDSAAVDAFAARAETGLGTLGSIAGLGGIWNADAVPSTRSGVWAPVAVACLLAVVAIGGTQAWRRRRRIPLLPNLFWLGATTVVLVVLAATGPGRAVLGWIVDTVPGAGLLRDTQKWVALLVPFYAVSAAFAVQAIGRWVPRGLAAVVAIGLIALPLPDLAWGVGGSIETVAYPRDWSAVADIVPADEGDVAVVPAGTNRRYAFTGGVVSLDPAARMLRAPVVTTGELSVGGTTVDRPDRSRATEVADVLDRGEPSDRLAELGVGWVLVEDGSTPATVSGLAVAFRGPTLTLYRVPAPDVVRASAGDRAVSWTAHGIWLGIIVLGFLGAAIGAGRRLVQWVA
ncbi:hypothetical protein [Williamsia phyllosphaerae]|uniref:Transmembrane protein n=1 Tax=Williamsia phyllosphaerae TaxID=885042 RepID=A0ABQ1UBT2_9NOCA|nr:hypothetical protein [Williamsia phyllosphaerae]GGF13993.1 hypothetical protein GCM10007298_07480 [Williamsia phyllosphaerae]